MTPTDPDSASVDEAEGLAQRIMKDWPCCAHQKRDAIVAALRAPPQSVGNPLGSGMREALESLREQCAVIVDDECKRILDQQKITTAGDLVLQASINANLRMIAVMLPEVSTAIRATTLPPLHGLDREEVVHAICLSYARKDLEPTSPITLALYRDDAEHAADAVLALPAHPVASTGWQDLESAPTDPLRDPPLVMLWVDDGGSKGTGTHAFGRCYPSHDGRIRAVASGFSGNWSIRYWRPLPGGPANSRPHLSTPEK